MCGDIIDTVRAADQSASAFHLTGFGTIATLVQMGKDYDMPKDDTRFLINLLHPEGNASKSSDPENVAKRTRVSFAIQFFCFVLCTHNWRSRPFYSLSQYSCSRNFSSYKFSSNFSLSNDSIALSKKKTPDEISSTQRGNPSISWWKRFLSFNVRWYLCHRLCHSKHLQYR